MRYLALVVISTTVTLTGAGLAQDDTRDARQLWDRMVAARGGHDRLEAVHGFAISVVAKGSHETFVVELPDQYWEWADYRPGKLGYSATVTNGAKHLMWWGHDGAVALNSLRPWDASEDLALMERIEHLQAVFLLQTKYFHPTLQRVLSDKPGQAILEATAPGSALLRYVVDLRTNLVTALSRTPLIWGPDVGQPPEPASFIDEFVFDKWRTVSGVEVPSRVKEGNYWTDVMIEINPDLDPKLFETRPDNVISADWWRKFLRKSPGKH